MAIDSAIKRASALSAGVVSLSLVVPSGTFEQGDKQTVANIYSGVLAIPPIATPDCYETVFSKISDSSPIFASRFYLDNSFNSLIDNSVTGVNSLIVANNSVTSTIRSTVSVNSFIDDSTISLESELCP